MTKITVSVCTYNGESRLPKVFEHLAKQVDVTPEQWEILVVDNASKDNTFQVVQAYQSAFKEICKVRCRRTKARISFCADKSSERSKF